MPLPFLWIFGRRDATISIMGANIYPEDVETAVYDRPEVAVRVRSFQLAVVQDEAANPRPGVLLELAEGVTVDDAWRDEQAAHIRDVLASLSRDYRTSLRRVPGRHAADRAHVRAGQRTLRRRCRAHQAAPHRLGLRAPTDPAMGDTAGRWLATCKLET